MEDMLSVHEFAQKIGVCDETVRRWIRSGDLEAARIRRRWHIPRTAQAPTELSTSHGR
mgnify:CR=1 FL=1